MSFSAQYEWLEPVTAGVPGSLKAREISSGRPVLVHLLARGDDRFRNLPSKKRVQVMSQGEYEGLEFVVLPEGLSFDEWAGSVNPDLLFQTGQWDITEIHRAAIWGQGPGAGVRRLLHRVSLGSLLGCFLGARDREPRARVRHRRPVSGTNRR